MANPTPHRPPPCGPGPAGERSFPGVLLKRMAQTEVKPSGWTEQLSGAGAPGGFQGFGGVHPGWREARGFPWTSPEVALVLGSRPRPFPSGGARGGPGGSAGAGGRGLSPTLIACSRS